jgi:DNA-binding transcriptional MerR regulator
VREARASTPGALAAEARPAQSAQAHQSQAKAADALRTIAEVSAELDLPAHVLRFWETKFPELRPVKRAGGRRYYRARDVELLRRIKTLLHGQGFTIRGARKAIRGAGTAEPEPEPAVEADRPTPRIDRVTRRALDELLGELEVARGMLAQAKAGDIEEA